MNRQHIEAAVVPVIAAVCFLVAGCDSGQRSEPVSEDTSWGVAAGGKETDADETSKRPDSQGSEVESSDDDWRTEKLEEEAWREGADTVEGPCGGDCRYSYEMRSRDDGMPWVLGRSQMRIEPSHTGTLRMLSVERAVFILSWTQHERHLRRHRLHLELEVDRATLELIRGEAYHHRVMADADSRRFYTFEYNTDKGELKYSVDDGMAFWEGKLQCPAPPLVLFGYREAPFDARGSHSALAAYLVGQRYEWKVGGTQRIPIFVPEHERIDWLEVSRIDAEKAIFEMRYPGETAKASTRDEQGHLRDTNSARVELLEGIPILIPTRDDYDWHLSAGPALEENLWENRGSAAAEGPVDEPAGAGQGFSVEVGERRIAGEIVRLEDGEARAMVLMLPGWDRRSRAGEIGAVRLYRQLAGALAEKGIASVRYDARGVGGSDGRHDAAGVEDLVADAKALLSHFEKDYEGLRFFVFCQGYGIHVASKLAAADERIAGVVVSSPIPLPPAEAEPAMAAHYLGNAGMSRDATEPLVQKVSEVISAINAGNYVGDVWKGHTPAAWRSLEAKNLIKAPTLSTPVLILAPEEDHIVPSEWASMLENALRGQGDVSKIALEETSHALTIGTAQGLWPEHGGHLLLREEAADAVVNWITKRQKKR